MASGASTGIAAGRVDEKAALDFDFLRYKGIQGRYVGEQIGVAAPVRESQLVEPKSCKPGIVAFVIRSFLSTGKGSANWPTYPLGRPGP